MFSLFLYNTLPSVNLTQKVFDVEIKKKEREKINSALPYYLILKFLSSCVSNVLKLLNPGAFSLENRLQLLHLKQTFCLQLVLYVNASQPFPHGGTLRGCN
jgi:hypothetical protein